MKTMRNLLAALALGTTVACAGEFEETLAKAQSGDVAAQIQVAAMYAKGQGVAKDGKEAAAWYQKAADQGNADAQMSLGRLYLGGMGLPKNSTEAAKWFRMAADQGQAAAQIQMARMHLAGAGVPKDYLQAWKWANLAPAKNEKETKPILDFLRLRMTPEQKFEADIQGNATVDPKAGGVPVEEIPLLPPPPDEEPGDAAGGQAPAAAPE